MIELKNISKDFGSGEKAVHAVRGVSLSIGSGEIFGIIGFSGAGKSTLVRCINLLERPSSGSVFVAGQDLTALSAKDLRAARKKIGMIFQHFNLMPSRTVAGNVAYPLKGSGLSKEDIQKKVATLLELVGIGDKADAYPSQLSGGQKQRVAIARALANDPQVLLCDEATSALDPQTTKAILHLLKHLNETLGITIVLITHEMAVVKEICDRVAVMEYGRVVEQGEVFTVFAEPKQDITKSFIHTTSNLQKVEALIAEDSPVTRLQPGELIVRLSYVQRNVNEPIISAVSQMFNVSLNIIFADITIVQDSPIGGTVAIISGERKQITKAIEYLIVNIAPNLASKLPDFYKALGDTMLMVLWSGLISFVFGLLLGVVLTVTKPNGILENKVVYQILDKLVSLFRSIPFIILLTWVMPITRALVGTVLYVRGAIVPLVFGSVPFFTRQVESALAELDGGLIEAALSMGSSPLEIIFRVYLKESIAAIARGTTITIVSLLNLTAMAGVAGAGGLGDFAIRYGHDRNMADITNVTVLVLVLIVCVIEFVGGRIVKKNTH